MKATGIVRRIDDLGRVVIPKEIRKTMCIRRGAQLEIFTDGDGGVIFKKYSPLEEYSRTASGFADTLARITSGSIAFCDRERIVAASTRRRRELVGKPVSEELSNAMDSRETLHSPVPTLREKSNSKCVLAVPVFANSEVIGCATLMRDDDNADEKVSESDEKTLAAAAALLGLQFEE
ncbi:MAG: stage V sporulation T C-terminal domain-containing protein [Oscillospiraceae bacterium]